ncbi:SET domain-containing protein 3 [Fulvia fulva]|uniref:SET domain-containing protein 3 n=1 Tax=Passalora fulva TaxID=5499 RepID=A0A9Q8LD07_PASFU|nr:SET domain-containing protein 3 [Fulvia fulva]KAK4628766.1 SET domain-containing protein 3 [Fulvia fulva]KAK4630505.1 SET domain-containing protein 3 [Fulvia fulva]UJO15109.1 SET domain-containing protein 3 [Fulvia fulva]WPV12881.1 SET domain-containing protein 3 [Fulvia fulva]WPV27021.1 SET domain-containing protein 3 [Fulvia fulva]
MTDTSYPVKAINGPHFAHNALASAYHPLHHQQHYHAPTESSVPEDDGQISCICGYADDDGWTVACDRCDRWQHQSCYYPQYDESRLPDDLEHVCVDCNPDIEVDHLRARQRQRQKREHVEPATNGIKRAPSKSHKKKVKEPGTAQTNGWPVDKLRHDRNSASPRDAAPPPAKRPKTSHRTSDSTTTTTTNATTAVKGHSRKRNVSSVNQRRSVSRSPESPVDLYSEEFLQRYREDEWAVTEANLYNSIAVTNSLSDWVNCSEEDFRAEHHQSKGEVLMRWDGVLDDIPGKAQIDIMDVRDNSVRYDGDFPVWKAVTVVEPVAPGAYIGELKGHVGFKTDYQQDDANRWTQLRHPEPFVFFHQQLPIFVDARNEGTELRYVRRSCNPNARLQILVTEQVNYHFCFMATQQIDPGVEVAVSWDTHDGLPELAARNNLTQQQLEVFSGWVSTALANCGPCACGSSECSMSRFDRRGRLQQDAQQKPLKGKKRKNGQHTAPLDTHTVNSRSGSEARKVDFDDDGTDSRSTSDSVGRGSASRDITPNTHYSTNGQSSGIAELSERERKKLAKEEEIFRKQEEERAGKQAKKKRNSNGSNLNTPSASSSKQFGFPNNNSKYPELSSTRPAAGPSARAPLGRKPKSSRGPGRPPNKVIKRTKPVYVDSATQCDLDSPAPPPRTPKPRTPFVSNRQRLLQMCARNNRAIAASQCARLQAASPAVTADKMELDSPRAESVGPPSSPIPVRSSELSASTRQPEPAVRQDVEMEDVSPTVEDVAESPHAEHGVPLPDADKDDLKQSPPIEPPAPPWPGKAPSVESEVSQGSNKPANMHIDMPPPTHPFSAAGMFATNGTPGSNANSVVQSPASLAGSSAFSPSVQAAVATTPAKKKLSLSDYTRRKAALQPSSSSEARAAEGGSAIDEDVKMEEAAEVAAAI